MPKKMPAVIVSPGIPKRSKEDFSAQMLLINSVGPYLLQACRNREEDEFYKHFFTLWFTLWPQTPKTVEDIPFVQHRVKLITKQTKYDLSFAKHRRFVPTHRTWHQYLAILEARHGIARSDANTTSLVEKPSEPSTKRYTVIIESSSDEEQEQPTSPYKKVSVMRCSSEARNSEPEPSKEKTLKVVIVSSDSEEECAVPSSSLGKRAHRADEHQFDIQSQSSQSSSQRRRPQPRPKPKKPRASED